MLRRIYSPCFKTFSIDLHVWWQFKEVNSHVQVHLLFRVDAQFFIRVD